MSVAALIAGVFIIALVLLDAFETVILPRRVTRRFRLARAYYRSTWKVWRGLGRTAHGKLHENWMSFFGPLSLLGLLLLWALGLILGFGLLEWALKVPVRYDNGPQGFATYLYFSGTCFFTLGFGDVIPLSSAGRALAVLESGTGFGFLAMVLGYLPVLYQSFSRREVTISLLDARAGTPPTAAELLRRHRDADGLAALHDLLRDWERWSAELMESHLSYPVLAYFRSQHDNQSWLGSLIAVLDTSALVMVAGKGAVLRQGRLTFAIARHALVDLSQVFGVRPARPNTNPATNQDAGEDTGRLTHETWAQMNELLRMCSGSTCGDAAFNELARLRALYEPYAAGLATYLDLSLPPWVPKATKKDNWQTSAWEHAARVGTEGH